MVHHEEYMPAFPTRSTQFLTKQFRLAGVQGTAVNMPKWLRAARRPSPNESLPILVAAIPLLALLGYAEMSASRSVSREAVRPLSLELNVAHADSELRLSWNPSASPLRGALAEIVITDGDHRSR